MPAESGKRFSMIREFHFAGWFTLRNAVCGTGALFSSMTYLQTGSIERIYVAGSLIFAGLVFDILDGRIARWPPIGRELAADATMQATIARVRAPFATRLRAAQFVLGFRRQTTP